MGLMSDFWSIPFSNQNLRIINKLLIINFKIQKENQQLGIVKNLERCLKDNFLRQIKDPVFLLKHRSKNKIPSIVFQYQDELSKNKKLQ